MGRSRRSVSRLVPAQSTSMTLPTDNSCRERFWAGLNAAISTRAGP